MFDSDVWRTIKTIHDTTTVDTVEGTHVDTLDFTDPNMRAPELRLKLVGGRRNDSLNYVDVLMELFKNTPAQVKNP